MKKFDDLQQKKAGAAETGVSLEKHLIYFIS